MAYDEGFVESFNQLANLLSGSDSQPAVDPNTVSRACRDSPSPAGIGPQGIFPGVKVAEPKPREDANEIWAAEEVNDGIDDVNDKRSAPEYEFIYKQAVETTDTFLGMSGKDASSTSCEDLVLRVQLPDVEKVDDIDVDLQAQSVTLRTSKQYDTSRR